MRVRFHAPYNHRWPVRAMTFFPAGYEGTVKRIVGEAAIAKGLATEVPHRATPTSDGGLPEQRRRGRVAEPDDAPDVGAVVRGGLLDGAGE